MKGKGGRAASSHIQSESERQVAHSLSIQLVHLLCHLLLFPPRLLSSLLQHQAQVPMKLFTGS
eukprot:671159-Hanusia_phi.AAC.1